VKLKQKVCFRLLHPPFTYTHTDEDGMLAEFVKTMNAIADGTPKDIRNATDDNTFERKSRDLVTLYRVSDASGSLEVSPVGKYPLKHEMLDTKDAFILDTGAGGIFAWLGSGATQQEKKAAFKNAVVHQCLMSRCCDVSVMRSVTLSI